MLTLQLLLVWACGFFDRIRGDKLDVPYGKTVEAIIYGAAVGAITGFREWELLLFALLWALGASFGWGTPIGAGLGRHGMDQTDLEWWQFGVLKTNVKLALAFRGLMWGVCVLPLAYFDMRAVLFVPAMTIIFPAAIYIWRNWEGQEYVRGWMAGAAALLIGMA